MMQHHINAMRQAAMAQGMERAGVRLGTVSGYDASNFLAKVILQPEGTETGWLPISALAVGNGWGIQAAPNIGDMVEVEFAEGGIDAGLITGRFFSDTSRPGAVPAGEFWVVHQSGSFIKFKADGSIQSSGNWNHTGTLTASDDVIGGGISLKNHVHPVGTGTTGAPQ